MKKEKAVTIVGSVSGATSIFGSWQICHAICTGIIALLSVFGIALVGFPFAFLAEYAPLFWIVAFIFLVTGIFLYLAGTCISSRMLLLNTGLLIAGVPFQSLDAFRPMLWLIGGTVIIVSILLLIQERRKKHERST